MLDRQDAVLGFLPRWIDAFAARVEAVRVIALSIGDLSHLPANVDVRVVGRSGRVMRYLRYQRYLREALGRDRFETVLAHMIPRYALLVRRSAWEALGGLDESLWLFFNDVDFSRRLLERSMLTRYLCEARVVHVQGASTSRLPALLERWHIDRLSYYRKHHGRLAGLWVKACTSLAWLDFAAQCAWS